MSKHGCVDDCLECNHQKTCPIEVFSKPKRLKKCCRCGERKEDVSFRVNPYNAEINNDFKKENICDNCHYEASMDI